MKSEPFKYFRFIFLKKSPVTVLWQKWNVRSPPALSMMLWSVRKSGFLVATKIFVEENQRKLILDTTMTMDICGYGGGPGSVHIPNKHSYTEREMEALGCLRPGKFSPSFSLSTTLYPTGWTVTTAGVGITRTWEGGLAAWERFEALNIENDDWVWLCRLREMRPTW